MSVDLHLAVLVVTRVSGIAAHACQRLTACTVCYHAQRVETGEVMTPALLVALDVCTSSEGAVGRIPLSGHVELGPVMASGLLRRHIPSRLPAGRDADDSAQSDEKHRLDAAVTLQIQCTVFADAVDRGVVSDERIAYMAGDPVVDRLGLVPRGCLSCRDPAGKGPEVRRERDMWKLLAQVLVQPLCDELLLGPPAEPLLYRIGEREGELVIAFKDLLEHGGAHHPRLVVDRRR